MQGSVINAHQITNMLTITPSVRNYLNYGLVTLRLVWVNDDEAEVGIAFHWLPLPGESGEISQTHLLPFTKNPLEEPRFRPVLTPGSNHMGTMLTLFMRGKGCGIRFNLDMSSL
ncbi:unnamed protein product [Penicillium salamii]|nr:unnamed protein product [Penicillium salamii]